MFLREYHGKTHRILPASVRQKRLANFGEIAHYVSLLARLALRMSLFRLDPNLANKEIGMDSAEKMRTKESTCAGAMVSSGARVCCARDSPTLITRAVCVLLAGPDVEPTANNTNTGMSIKMLTIRRPLQHGIWNLISSPNASPLQTSSAKRARSPPMANGSNLWRKLT